MALCGPFHEGPPSSGVEHSLGKGEVESSNLSVGTSFINNPAPGGPPDDVRKDPARANKPRPAEIELAAGNRSDFWVANIALRASPKGLCQLNSLILKYSYCGEIAVGSDPDHWSVRRNG